MKFRSHVEQEGIYDAKNILEKVPLYTYKLGLAMKWTITEHILEKFMDFQLVTMAYKGNQILEMNPFSRIEPTI
jgi:hypothetical protein